MKNLFFSCILIVITCLFIELFGYAAYRVKFGDYQVHALQLDKNAAVKATQSSGVFVPEQARNENIVNKPILHPYIGFTVDGHVRKEGCESEKFAECFKRIKVDTDRPFAERADNRLIVGILGGSFADGTADRRDTLARAFRALPMFAAKSEVIVYNMAAGAFKQPQQLTQAAYYMALGAEFDILINLDGFNEIAGSYYGWRDSQLHPAFPKSWNHRVSSSLNKEYLIAFSKKHNESESRRSFAELAGKFPLRWSPTLNFIWRVSDIRYKRNIDQYDSDITALGTIEPSQRDFALEALGPDYEIEDFVALVNYVSTVWVDSSLALRALAEGTGARYFHFLQPNQYIEGAKILSEEEKEIAILEKGGYGNVYKKGYPSLLKHSARLVQEGVSYHDLTNIFKDNSATLYVDNCCHLNLKGYDMVATKLASVIGDNWYELK